MNPIPHSHTVTIGRFLRRYHLVLGIVVLSVALIGVVLTLNSIIQKSVTPAESGSAPRVPSFDQATIDRIKGLRSSEEAPSPLTMPAGQRTNPFSE